MPNYADSFASPRLYFTLLVQFGPKPLARKILIFSSIVFVLICLSFALAAPAFFAEEIEKEEDLEADSEAKRDPDVYDLKSFGLGLKVVHVYGGGTKAVGADFPNSGLPIRWIPVGSEPIFTDFPYFPDEDSEFENENATMIPPTSLPAFPCNAENGQLRGRIKFEGENEEWIWGRVVNFANEYLR